MPSSRYFSVAGPNERAERLRRQRDGALRVGHGRAAVAAHGDGLDPLRAQHGPQSAPAGEAAVVADRGERDEPLPRRPDRRDLPLGPDRRPQPGLSLRCRQTPQLTCWPPRHQRLAAPLTIHEQHRGLAARPVDRDRVDPRPLGRQREVRRRQGVAEPAGERAERDDRELGRRGQRGADQRAECEDERRVDSKRVGAGGRLAGDDPGPQAHAAEEPAQYGLVERLESRQSRAGVDL